MNGQTLIQNVFYQVYPRSFKDSNGDGIGDIQGVIDKLDYLQDLGIDGVWFSPFFKSPQRDFGYDITDYCDIAPGYGTMDDFDRLVAEMHRRGMKVILDMVLNHTSDRHPWFVESASSRNNPKRDWYIWRDGRVPGGRLPPNNWKSWAGGPAWRYFENIGQWVYFQFLPFQPDLNYRNPEVKETMCNVLRFWLNKGVDGFRLDIIATIFEDEQLRNNPVDWNIFRSGAKNILIRIFGRTGFTKNRYDRNLPETLAFVRDLRKIVDEYEPMRFLVGEVFGPVEEIRKYCGPHNNGLNMIFLFEFTSTPFRPEAFAGIIKRIEQSMPSPSIPTYVLGNHDRRRYISNINNDVRKAKILATLMLTLRGVPFIYYGEEIGMPNTDFPLKGSLDPIAQKYAWLPASLVKRLGLRLSRDGCRTPMQWSAEPNGGFSSHPDAKPWLEISPSYKTRNVAQEETDLASLLNCYKKLISLRKKESALSNGRLEMIDMGDLKERCLAYRRMYEGQEISVYLNFSDGSLSVKCDIAEPFLLFSTSGRKELPGPGRSGISLGPFEGILIKKQSQTQN